MTEIKPIQHIAYLGLGSNIGEREGHLLAAIRQLHAHPEVDVTAVSALYETDPVGYTEQPAFLNMACRIVTTLDAHTLLEHARRIESTLGRERVIRWGPRTIDIDVLLYNDCSINTDDLTVPHPRIMERAFVLVPLVEVLEEAERGWRPGFEQLEISANGVREWTNINWPEESGHSES